MTISERLFKRMKAIGMSQKMFSEKTGIAQSTISEWKKKKTNPTSEKIMIICEVLDVTPEWLLSGTGKKSKSANRPDWYVIDGSTELGQIVTNYNAMNSDQRSRMIGYMTALMTLLNEP